MDGEADTRARLYTAFRWGTGDCPIGNDRVCLLSRLRHTLGLSPTIPSSPRQPSTPPATAATTAGPSGYHSQRLTHRHAVSRGRRSLYASSRASTCHHRTPIAHSGCTPTRHQPRFKPVLPTGRLSSYLGHRISKCASARLPGYVSSRLPESLSLLEASWAGYSKHGCESFANPGTDKMPPTARLTIRLRRFATPGRLRIPAHRSSPLPTILRCGRE